MAARSDVSIYLHACADNRHGAIVDVRRRTEALAFAVLRVPQGCDGRREIAMTDREKRVAEAMFAADILGRNRVLNRDLQRIYIRRARAAIAAFLSVEEREAMSHALIESEPHCYACLDASDSFRTLLHEVLA
ncbi:MAG: hypothetical protein NVSMB31_14440 [Vulcanimicrobiaceae bacterium]